MLLVIHHISAIDIFRQTSNLRVYARFRAPGLPYSPSNSKVSGKDSSADRADNTQGAPVVANAWGQNHPYYPSSPNATVKARSSSNDSTPFAG